ncbi:helix-turn-helix domain-containing protein [Rhizobium sp. SEMIA 4085]|uniref:Helix-turn-helix domain-containing protein n=1 Tax=Rhizobium gallicum bv. gallicum R602sp TaxID=1041138 RepID=A0A0B4XA13_9HYPH|nr:MULTISPECIES: helix-turn-helix domain-containing protein [Rhizobium]AJD43580.1 helix-turn-helix domain-containing protein [Rhizobium gallicum bv. gallicum R602sp]NNH33115.1 helix-turn-helix domain-containing protein [Rhizobium sp. SEMIA 4085]TDW34077.1 helix-turn-helix protein [Rhizobium azibense]
MESLFTEVIDRLARIEATLASPRKEYLTVEDAADFISISKVLLDEWRCKGGGPAYHKIGRRVVYSVADLRAFASASRVEALR